MVREQENNPFVPSCQDVGWLMTHELTSRGEWILLEISIPLFDFGPYHQR